MGIRRFSLAVTVAAVVLVPAVAVAADSWLGPVQTAVPAGGGVPPENPGIAIDPVGQAATAIAFSDTTRVKVTSKGDWVSGNWSSPTTAQPMAGGDAPAIVWGAGANVYVAAEQTASAPCDPLSSLALTTSTTAGGSFGVPVPFAQNSTTSFAREPSIAFDAAASVVYVAYARLHAGVPPCEAGPSEIVVAVFAQAGTFTREFVVPLGGGSTRGRHPAIVVTGKNQIVIALQDTTGTRNDIETVSCDAGATPACATPVVVAAGTAASTAAPAIAASGGRIVVAWQAGDAPAARVRSATSLNGGVSFGPSVPLDPSTDTSAAPSLASTANGRIDAVYLGNGQVRSVSSLAGGASEQWATPVTVATSNVDPLWRLAVATSVASDLPAGPARTLLVWVTLAGDLKLVPILHGLTTPVVTPGQTFTVAKGTATALHIDARDDDGDPLTYAVSAQPTSPGASATFADSVRSTMTFKAGHVGRAEQVDVTVTDLAGHTATGTITVTVKNAPPEITCTTLFVAAGKDLPIDPAGCADDPDADSLTFALSDAIGGKLALTESGYAFTPQAGAKSSFLYKVSDGESSMQARINVAVLSTDSKVAIKIVGGESERSVYAGATLRLRATGTDATGHALPVSWDFGDGSARSRGGSVTHAFARPGLWYVTASTTSTAARFRVRVYPRPFGLVGAIRFDGHSTVLVSLHCWTAGTLTARVLGSHTSVRRTVGAGATARSLHIPTGALAHRGTITIMVAFAPTRAGPLPVAQLRRVVAVPAALRR